MPGASRLIPVHERVDRGQARMPHPAAAPARPGVPVTGHRGGAGEKRGGGRAGGSRSPRERPRRSATEPAPAGRPRSPRLHHMLLYLSAPGQRSKMHNACSRCDSYMKGFQPSRRDELIAPMPPGLDLADPGPTRTALAGPAASSGWAGRWPPGSAASPGRHLETSAPHSSLGVTPMPLPRQIIHPSPPVWGPAAVAVENMWRIPQGVAKGGLRRLA